MKKNKEKEKNTNPYHKEYGVFSNSIHALKSMLGYSHKFILVITISIVCAPIMQYLWSFISKFVIDMITTGQSTTALALLMGWIYRNTDYGYYAEPLRQLVLSRLYRSKIQADGT